MRGPKPSAESCLGDGNWASRGIELVKRCLGCIRLDLMVAQPGRELLGFRERARENRSAFDAPAARDPDRLRCPAIRRPRSS